MTLLLVRKNLITTLPHTAFPLAKLKYKREDGGHKNTNIPDYTAHHIL